jgi:hypothetical protein
MRPHAASSIVSAGARFTGMLLCLKCGEPLVSPETSAYLGGGRVQHLWSCDGCGQEFRSIASIATPAGSRGLIHAKY